MIFPKTKKAKIILPTALILTVVVAVGLFWPHSAHASITTVFGQAIGWLLYAILVLFAKLLVAVIQMLVAVASYNDFTNATAVIKGWVITRDVCNMFFIGILLMMAFGTILKWETYRYNKMLGRLILMAFLINFSKFICGFFIDIFQVIMLTFVNAFSGAAAGTFANALGIKEMLQMSVAGNQEYEFQEIIGSLFLALLLVTVALIVMIAITIVLLMRIIWLWVLIVLSPVAFLLKTWPGGGEKFSSRWWGDFGKNLTGGPMLAFFLWLALTIMTTRGDTQSLAEKELNINKDAMSIEQPAVLESGGSQPGGETAQKFYATISEISSSDQLLSYIISISLLIGALMMGQQMGVAGGSAISWAQGKTGGLLRKAAVLGAAGLAGGALGTSLAMNAKKNWENVKKVGGGIRGGIRNRLMKATGLELRAKKWTEAWTYSGQKHEEEAEAGMRSKAQQRFAKGNVVGSMLGSPAHGIYDLWRTSTFKKVFKGELTPKNILKRQQEAEGKEDEFKGMAEDIGMVRNKETGQWASPEDQELNDVIKEETDKREKDLTDQHLSASVDDYSEYLDEVYRMENAGIDPETIRRTRDKYDHLHMKGGEEEYVDEEGKLKKRKTTIYFDDAWNKEAMRLRAESKTEPEVHEARLDFEKNWAKQFAIEEMTKSKEREGIEQNLRVKYATPEKREELRKGYIKRQQAELDKQEKDLESINKGERTVKQQENHDLEIKKLEKLLEKIDNDIKKKTDAGIDASRDITFRDEKRREIDALRLLKLSEKEKAQHKDILPTLQEQIRKTKFKIDYAEMGEVEKQGLLDKQEAKKKEWEAAQKEYDKIRPSVDYEMRKAQRLAINKEKSEITTDSWQELLSFIEDAKKKGDLNKAAAGYLKAAEYANANEIQNGFGYDSDAKGLKEFIMGELVGTSGGLDEEMAEKAGLSWHKYYDSHGIEREGFEQKKGMGMSFEQATAVGNDVSYTGEGVNHWGIARAVGVRNGHQVWQKENDRILEVMAEVRKADFETVMRRFNRLALGNEYVQDKYDFKATGRRNFEMNDFAMAFVKENFSKFDTLMGRGRFGVNLAINLTKPVNIQMMQEMAKEMPFQQRQAFQTMLQAMRNYGTGGLDEFSDLMDIQNMRARGRFAS